MSVLTESDMDMFLWNGKEYLRRTIEGPDLFTRRRTVVDFAQALCVHHKVNISHLVTAAIYALVVTVCLAFPFHFFRAHEQKFDL